MCPVLEGEEQLRLLNYQHNSIREISHLSALKRLIFLDLYDNMIEEISGLGNLRSLRVLMLGKNRCDRRPPRVLPMKQPFCHTSLIISFCTLFS